MTDASAPPPRLSSPGQTIILRRMRVACPNCSAEYALPPAVVARLDGVRTVRCARCGTAWAPEPPVAEAPPAPAPAPELPRPVPEPVAVVPRSPPPPLPEVPPAPPPLVTPPPAPRPAAEGPRVALAWVLSLAILGAAAWGAWHYREEIMAAWPPSIRAYAALGLAG